MMLVGQTSKDPRNKIQVHSGGLTSFGGHAFSKLLNIQVIT